VPSSDKIAPPEGHGELVAIDEEIYGKKHFQYAIDIGNLASLYAETNRLAEAEAIFKRSIAVLEVTFPSSHPYLVMAQKNYMVLLKRLGRSVETDDSPE
jgi:hypothetical protein